MGAASLGKVTQKHDMNEYITFKLNQLTEFLLKFTAWLKNHDGSQCEFRILNALHSRYHFYNTTAKNTDKPQSVDSF